ncbi:MAG TPA: DUF1963 domain-containing protein [Longimicrobiaceae bacterium]
MELPEITARLAEHRRPAYVPVVEDGDGPPGASGFSGTPSLLPGEPWPACGNCGRPMQLFVQLAGRDLPPAARDRIGPGELLQLFYCTSEDPPCESDCEAFFPDAESTLLRIVPAGAAGDAPAVPGGMFPPKRIVGWREEEDYPNFEELEERGVELDDEELDVLSESFPLGGEKLLGWPAWVQSIEYPDCRVCGKRMEMLFQIDSERNLPYMFGDVGTGHVTQCPEHRGELAFGWACS